MKAPRRPFCLWRRVTRGALLMSGMWLSGAAAGQDAASPVVRGNAITCVGEMTDATYEGATDRYPHGVLGDDLEWSILNISYRSAEICRNAGGSFSVRLPEALVFEDVAPRIVDLDGAGHPEIIVVESHQTQGARLAVWGIRGDMFTRIAATPFIGRRFRWLAPVGVSDLDGDGQMELAYVDRPHLAKTLRVWRFADDHLREVASREGVTNHRIGERDIAGGIRECGTGPEMIVADANWRAVWATRFDGTDFAQQRLGPHRGRSSFTQAMACKPVK